MATELRLHNQSDVSLEADENAIGTLDNLDYNPVYACVNLRY